MRTRSVSIWLSRPFTTNAINERRHSCRNFDGGFGCVPGAESHAGQVFTCVGALAIGHALQEEADAQLLGWWLCERQCDSGGLNGRPEKQVGRPVGGRMDE